LSIACFAQRSVAKPALARSSTKTVVVPVPSATALVNSFAAVLARKIPGPIALDGARSSRTSKKLIF